MISDSDIDAINPPGSGTADVTVISPGVKSSSTSADQFTLQ